MYTLKYCGFVNEFWRFGTQHCNTVCYRHTIFCSAETTDRVLKIIITAKSRKIKITQNVAKMHLLYNFVTNRQFCGLMKNGENAS